MNRPQRLRVLAKKLRERKADDPKASVAG